MKPLSPFEKVISNSIFFSVGTVIGKIVNIAMLPVYTYFLTDIEYGIVNTLTGFSTILCIVTMLSLRASLMRFYGTTKQQEKPIFINTVLCVIILNTFLVIGVLFILKDWLMKSIFKGIEFWPLVFFALLIILFTTLFTAYQTILQAKQEGKKYTISNMLYMFIHAILNILFIVILKRGASGYMISLLLANLFLAFFGIAQLYLSGDIVFKINWNYAKKAIRYALPIVPHDLSNNVSEYISKVYLNNFLSYAATGIFSIASQVSGMMSLVQTSLNLAFHPWFNEQMGAGEQGRKNIKKFSLFVFTIYCYFCMGLSFFSKEALFLLAADEYHGAWRLVPIIALGLVIRFIYYTHVLAILYNVKASNFISVCSISGCLANCVSSYLFIKFMGLYGAAFATIAYILFLTVITVLYCNKYCKVDFGLSSMMLSLLIMIAIMGLGLWPDYMGHDNNINFFVTTYKALITIIVTGGILFMYKKQIQQLWILFRQKRGGK
mgnify:CR=1 FL=1